MNRLMPLWRGSASRIGLHEERQAGAFDSVRDPRLRAVDHIVVAFAPRGHADACRSVPASGSVSASPPRISPLASFGSQSSFAGRAELLDRKREHQMRVDNARHRHPDRGDPHHDLRVCRRRKAEPAVFGADRCPEQPELSHLLDDLRRVAIRVVVLLDDRLEVAVDPTVDRVEQLCLVGLVDGVCLARSLSPPVRSIMPDGRRWTRPRSLRSKRPRRTAAGHASSTEGA